MSHVLKMLQSCQARVEGLASQGAFPAKGAARQKAMGAEALAFCVGYEEALIHAGVIEQHFPIVWLISIRGYEQVAAAIEAMEKKAAEAA